MSGRPSAFRVPRVLDPDNAVAADLAVNVSGLTKRFGTRIVVDHLDLRNAIHIGHSTGGGEVARYVARHGKGRVAKAVLISSVDRKSVV